MLREWDDLRLCLGLELGLVMGTKFTVNMSLIFYARCKFTMFMK